MPSPNRIDFQIGMLCRRCASVLVGLVLATAQAVAAGVTLAWDPVDHPLLSGYAVYVGSAPGNYDVRFLVGDATSYEVVGLDEGRSYHFAVTAYDVFYRESAYSNDVGTTVPYRVPAVEFSASATRGPSPLALNFVATVQGTVTSYLWSFGDGATSTAPNPVHVYEAAGTYNVSVTVAGPGGSATSSRPNYVTVVSSSAGMGQLAGALTAAPASVDLTSIGTIDWVQWPGNVRKGGVVPLITGPMVVGRGAVVFGGIEPGTLQWRDGTPILAGSTNEAVSVSGTGRGLSITAPADPTPRRLTLFVGGTNANGRLTARLSDGSAPVFVHVPVRKMGSRWRGAYALTYRAAAPGQVLTVEWTQARGLASPGAPASGVSIQGAALAWAE